MLARLGLATVRGRFEGTGVGKHDDAAVLVGKTAPLVRSWAAHWLTDRENAANWTFKAVKVSQRLGSLSWKQYSGPASVGPGGHSVMVVKTGPGVMVGLTDEDTATDEEMTTDEDTTTDEDKTTDEDTATDEERADEERADERADNETTDDETADDEAADSEATDDERIDEGDASDGTAAEVLLGLMWQWRARAAENSRGRSAKSRTVERVDAIMARQTGLK